MDELKQALSAQGINFTNKSFTEGISHTQLIDGSSQLPTNLNYKGKVTNNLVILLTNTQKNISLGAVSRKEAYMYIKEHNLQNKVKQSYGRNFTQVPTEGLWDIITTYVKPSELSAETTVKKNTEKPSEDDIDLDSVANDILKSYSEAQSEEVNPMNFSYEDLFEALITKLYKDNVISRIDLLTLKNSLADLASML